MSICLELASSLQAHQSTAMPRNRVDWDWAILELWAMSFTLQEPSWRVWNKCAPWTVWKTLDIVSTKNVDSFAFRNNTISAGQSWCFYIGNFASVLAFNFVAFWASPWDLPSFIYNKINIYHCITCHSIINCISMKLGHIIKYHNVFKFHNGPYRIMPLGVIALCWWHFPIYANLAIAGASVSYGHISSFDYEISLT